MCVALIVLGGFLLSRYLSANNLLFYATGSSDKAFVNATWKMSPPEIERANNAKLFPYDDPFVGLGDPAVMDRKRFTESRQKDLFLWGYPAELTYAFFDNMLYEYYINLTAYDLDKPFKDILATLRAQFGEGKEPSDKRKDLIHSLEWNTDKQNVYCWMGKNDKDNSYYVGVRATYKPVKQQIDDIAKSEKKKYF